LHPIGNLGSSADWVISAEQHGAIEASIRANYHKGWRAEDKYPPEGYQKDLADFHGSIWPNRARLSPGSMLMRIP
jgi:hypothetical protein